MQTSIGICFLVFPFPDFKLATAKVLFVHHCYLFYLEGTESVDPLSCSALLTPSVDFTIDKSVIFLEIMDIL